MGRRSSPSPFGLVYAYVRSTVFSDSVLFLVDTGCHTTTISGADAVRIGIDYSRLTAADKDALGATGRSKKYYVKDVSITFSCDDSSELTESLAKIDILEPTQHQISSLLGMDVLRNYDIHNRSDEYYLEK
jgi:predicted aspartyl protease